MQSTDENKMNVKGWGVDIDPENDPTYPMKKFNGDDHLRLDYDRPPMQPVTNEILHSNERPGLTAVFGTPHPPKGLSGLIRRYAFRYSEGSWAHWLPLLLADRVDVVEGLIDDLKHGHIPNIIKERGWSAEWKYNRSRAIKKIAIKAAVAAAIIIWVSAKRRPVKSS